MIKKILAITLSTVMIFTITACSMPTSIDDVKNVLTDTQTEFPVDTGQEVISEAPKDIVVLDDNLADVLITCGYTENIIGKSSECNQGELLNVKVYGSNARPDTKGLINLKPDVIFASDDIDYNCYEKLKDNGIIVLRMADSSTVKGFKSFYSNICKIMDGNITGVEKGEKTADRVINSIEKSKGNNIVRGCYLYELDGESAVTSEMYSSELMSIAGIQNITTENDRNGHFAISQIVAVDKQEGFPFYIFCKEGMREKVMSDDTLKKTNAVSKNRVVEIPSKYITRQGKTAIEGVMYIKSIINGDSSATGISVAVDYGITITDNMSYTLDDQSSDVLAIQNRLSDLGYLSIKPTGYFGESTVEAVKEFQINNELKRRDGVADKNTIERLFSTSAFSKHNVGNPSEETPTEVVTESNTFSAIIVDW